MGYSYYDTPDGQDCFNKLGYLSKKALFAGITVSTFDVLLFSHPKGYMNTLQRYGHFTVPFLGMAAAFTASTCLATNYRNKDDAWNYALGGLSAGTVFGIWRKNFYGGMVVAVGMAIFAMAQHQAHANGMTLLSQVHPMRSGSRPTSDWSILKDPKNSA